MEINRFACRHNIWNNDNHYQVVVAVMNKHLSTILLSFLIITPVSANTLAPAELLRDLASGEASQKQVALAADSAVAARQELLGLEQQLKDLNAYNRYMNTMVAGQERELTTLQDQLANVEETRQALVPLLLKMQSDLESWVASDIPLRSVERAERLEMLRKMMADAKISESEKYRVLLQAYQVEAEYGQRLDVWQQHLRLDGEERLVNIVSLGRIALLAMTPDGHSAWRWSTGSNNWLPLDGKWQAEVAKAIALGEEKQTPTLLMLPLSVSHQEEGL